MRVLHLFDWYLPSTLSWVSRLLWHLPDTEPWVAAPWILNNAFREPQWRYFTFPPQRWWFPDLHTEGQHARAQYLFTRSQRFLPSYRYWLAQQVQHDPPDVLHAHFGPTGCLYLPLAKQLKRPLVVTFYGFDYRKLLLHRPVFREKYKVLFAGAARVLAASPKGCQALEDLGCPPEKLSVVRPSPDLSHFPFAERHKPAGRLRLLQAATITAKKGHLTTLEALQMVVQQYPVHLTLAGEPYDTGLVRQIRQFIAQHGLEAQVDWVGPVPHAGMAAFFGRFDAFVHPSCTAPDGDHEATPVVLLEAQASGLPVLATHHFDLADEVAHGHSGWLVPEGDAAALAEAMRMFCLMPDQEYQGFSRNARAWVEQGFQVQQSALALRKIYQELLEKPTFAG
ncbi:MAG: glycosyltransferase family 4 protein [Saprospiraceae bacterium]|nr:glycosyltransferase family 4 protein [Saprospiraceae bacterium]